MSMNEEQFRAAIVDLCKAYDVRLSGDWQGDDLRVDGVSDSNRGWICREVGPDGWKD